LRKRNEEDAHNFPNNFNVGFLIYKKGVTMEHKDSKRNFGKLKERLDASGLTRREAVLYALGATCPLLIMLAGKDKDYLSADKLAQKRCVSDADCSGKCVTCSAGCSSCPPGCSGGGPNR
jgi:hypothetical protein